MHIRRKCAAELYNRRAQDTGVVVMNDGGGAKKGVFYGWYIVGAVFFMIFVTAGFRQSFGLFVPAWSEDFNVSVGQLSLVASAGWVVNGLAQPVVGALADRHGPRIVMTTSVVVLGVSTLAMAFAGNIWMLAFFYATFASFSMAGAQFTPVTPLIARWFVRRRAAALSVLTSGGSAGAMLLLPFAAYLMQLTNWRAALLAIVGMLGILVLPLVVIIIRNRPEQMGLEPDGGAVGGAVSRRGTGEGPLAVEKWRHAYRTAPMWQLTFTYVVCGVTTAIISVHFVSFAKNEGISVFIAALAFGLLSMMNMLGVLGLGAVSDRFMRKNALTVIYAVRGVGFLTLLIMPISIGLWAFAVISGVSWLATVPQTSALAAEVYGVRNAGTITGMLTMVHMLAGAVAVAAAGLAYELLGSYDVVWVASVAMLGAAAFTAWSLREKDVSARYLPVQASPRLTEA